MFLHCLMICVRLCLCRSVSKLNECHSSTSGHSIKLRKFRKFSGHFDGKQGHSSLINEDKENYFQRQQGKYTRKIPLQRLPSTKTPYFIFLCFSLSLKSKDIRNDVFNIHVRCNGPDILWEYVTNLRLETSWALAWVSQCQDVSKEEFALKRDQKIPWLS